jgi:dihydroneopterin triphosphate diphosphatase
MVELEIKSSLIEAHIIRFVNDKIEYLLLKRSAHQKYPNIWQMVTGKINEGEKAYETVVREVGEETSLEIDKLFIVPNVNSFYNPDDNSTNLIPVFVTVVNEDEVVTISEEHQRYQWVNKKKAKRMLAWPGQSKSVDFIYEFFSSKKENLNFIEINLS